VPPGDRAALFDAADRETAVPMIPEFTDYLLSELEKRKFLVPMEIVSVAPVKFEMWKLTCTAGDANIIEIAERGLKSGTVRIPGTDGPETAMRTDGINNVTDYLTGYAGILAEHIKRRFVPLFDPGTDEISAGVAAVNETIAKKAGYSLYNAQLAAAEALRRRLAHGKSGILIAECGSGKTKIGLAALLPAVAKRDAEKTFNAVLCPSHLTKKWVREIGECTDDAIASVVTSPAEFDALLRLHEKSGKHCFAVISKETARDGYMRAPAAVWSESRKAFVCPDCGGRIEMRISDDAGEYKVSADQFFFKRETGANHKCESCGSPLWTALNPRAKGLWAKIGDYGFVFAPRAREHLRKTKNPATTEKIRDIADGNITAAGARRKYPLSSYIRKKHKGRIDGLIVDELHQYSHNSGQGDAMGELFAASGKVVGLTATLINGYSSGLFYLLYRLMPGLMEADGQSHAAPSAFAAEYGVTESSYEVTGGDYSANRRTVIRKKRSRQLPGVSPLIYTKFLLGHAVFLSLSDMGKDLPGYREIPEAVRMPKNVSDAYCSMQKALVSFMKENRKAAPKILSSYLNLLIAYPDQPYGPAPVFDPFLGDPIVTPPDTAEPGSLLPKDEAALRIAGEKVRAGENVLIYTNWTRLDTADRLLAHLSEAGIRACVLGAKVKPAVREEWIAERLDEGIRVLITNPAVVETGLDLNAFTTLIFYDTGTKLFTMRQASRRSWRINQTAPRVEVYMLYYADTVQHRLLRLMGTKLAAATMIEGGYSEEGLAAMSQCEDMTALMAKELMLGIKDSVEDVSALFGRMAVPGRREAVCGVFSDIPPEMHGSPDTAGPAEFTFVEFTFTESPKPQIRDTETPEPAGRKPRPAHTDENQLTFFQNIA
jgi:superfamily II DNA or RNA helicase